MSRTLQKPFILFVILAAGILLAMLLVKSRSPLEHSGNVMQSTDVQVIEAKRMPFRATVTAYGSVEPAVTLRTLAEVSGKISYLHPDLQQGNTIEAGTVVARIDPEDYEVSLKQTQADLVANESTLKQLQTEEQTTRRSLKLARKNLQVGEKELERIRSVWEKRLIARSSLDAEEQKVIQLRQQLEELQGQLNSYASRKASVEAQITRAREQVKGQQTTLGRTEIVLPFTSRIGAVTIEQGQYVSVGSNLFEALDIKGVEINAQVPIQHMRSLVSHLRGKVFDPAVMRNTRNILSRLNLNARVRLVGNMPDAIWEARVLRFSEAIDPVRRTLGVVVGINRPYEQIIAGVRPPLLKGMFTAVEIYAPEREAMVIPRKAIHHERVYVVDAEQRLEIKPVTVLQQQDDLAVIQSGLEEGDQVIINDLVPVIEGMPLNPVRATTYEQELNQRASGL